MALNFDDASGHDTIEQTNAAAQIDCSSAYTWMAWVKFDNLDIHGVVTLGDLSAPGDSDRFYLWGSDVWGGIFYRSGSSTNLQGSTTLSAGTWYHLAITRDGNAVKCYVNGVQDGSANANNASRTPAAEEHYGEDSWGTGFDGDLDEIKTYQRLLSADEIAAESTQVMPVSWDSILGCYALTGPGSAEYFRNYVGTGDLSLAKGSVTVVASHGNAWGEGESDLLVPNDSGGGSPPATNSPVFRLGSAIL